MAIKVGDNFSSGHLYSKSKTPTTNTEEIFECKADYYIYTAKDNEFGSIDFSKPEKRNNANKKTSSKERRKRYTTALERAVQSLKIASTSLSAQRELLQKDTTGMSLKNSELKLRMQSMENEVRFQYARNEALKKDIEELRAMVQQCIQNNAPTTYSSFDFGDISQQLESPNLTLDHLQQPKQDTMTDSYSDYRLF